MFSGEPGSRKKKAPHFVGMRLVAPSLTRRGIKVYSTMLLLLFAVVHRTASAATHRKVIAITHVNVIPMTSASVLMDQTVLISDNKIIAVGSAGVSVPDSAVVIDGSGQYLLPGLADMHVHIGPYVPGMGQTRPDPLIAPIADSRWNRPIDNELWLYLANGVTTVRNMAGSPTTLLLAKEISDGKRIGPRIFSASPIIDGVPPSARNSAAHLFTDPKDATSLVATFKAQGYRYVKVYNMLDAASYYALSTAAHSAGMKVVGHVPFAVGLKGVLDARQDSIEHLRGYDFDPSEPPTTSLSVKRFKAWDHISDDLMMQYARETVRAGTWNCPTLVDGEEGAATGEARDRLFEALDKLPLSAPLRAKIREEVFGEEIDKAIASGAVQRRKMTKILFDAGAKLLPGTDTAFARFAPGYSLHRELELFVNSGLTPYQAIRTATVGSQTFLGDSDLRGTIEVGKDADLVLLKANPLSDIKNLGQISGIVSDGRWYDAKTLQKHLRETSDKR